MAVEVVEDDQSNKFSRMVTEPGYISAMSRVCPSIGRELTKCGIPTIGSMHLEVDGGRIALTYFQFSPIHVVVTKDGDGIRFMIHEAESARSIEVEDPDLVSKEIDILVRAIASLPQGQ